MTMATPLPVHHIAEFKRAARAPPSAASRQLHSRQRAGFFFQFIGDQIIALYGGRRSSYGSLTTNNWTLGVHIPTQIDH